MAVTVRLHSLAAKGGDAEGDTFPYTWSTSPTQTPTGLSRPKHLPDVENLIGSEP